MNVQFLSLSVSRNAGGLFFSVRSLAKHIQSSNTNCRVLGPRDEFTDEDVSEWAPVHVDPFDVIGPKSFGYSYKIEKLIGRPDIQHVHGIWMYHSYVNRKIAKKNSVPYIISPRGMLDPWAISNSRWKKKLVGWLYENRHLRDADCIHALCESEVESIRAFGLKNPICIIPNAVDLPILDQGTKEILPRQKKRLLFIGRIHPKKGLLNLINAFAKLDVGVRSDWEIVIAGWDQNHQQELQKRSHNLGIADSVKFCGPHFGDQKENLIRSCDAFVLPSFSEGLPMSVLEAWSYALPTLITTACNLPEGHKFNATIQCEPNESSIQKGLYELLTLNDTECQMMGKRARALTEERFCWPVVSAQMIEVYRWLLKETAAPNTVQFN